MRHNCKKITKTSLVLDRQDKRNRSRVTVKLSQKTTLERNQHRTEYPCSNKNVPTFRKSKLVTPSDLCLVAMTTIVIFWASNPTLIEQVIVLIKTLVTT